MAANSKLRTLAVLALAVAAVLLVAIPVALTRGNDQDNSASASTAGQEVDLIAPSTGEEDAALTEETTPTASPVPVEADTARSQPDGEALEQDAVDEPSQPPSDAPSIVGYVESDSETEETEETVLEQDTAGETIFSDAPSDEPSLAPSDAPSLAPSLAPSDSEPEETEETVLEQDAAGETIFSDAPSDEPSLAPSDVPSLAPSDVPSMLPSGTPSGSYAGLGSDFPSLSPTSWVLETAAPTILIIPTTVAVAGPDYVVLAVETKSSAPIMGTVSRLIDVSSTTQVASAGCRFNVDGLANVINMRTTIYESVHESEMPTPIAVKTVSSHLWNNRFNQCFDYTMTVGLDLYGTGAVYNYNELGQFLRVDTSIKGSNAETIGYAVEAIDVDVMSAGEVKEIIEEAYLNEASIGNLSGNAVEFAVITPAGLELSSIPLDAS